MKQSMLESILRDVDSPAERETLRQSWDRLEALEQVEPSPELARRFSSAVKLSRTLEMPLPSWGRRLLPIAALLVVGATIGGLAIQRSRVASNDDLPTAAERASSVIFIARPLASQRLEAVESLAALTGDREIGRILGEVAGSDPSVGIRLVAIDAIEPYVADEAVARRLIQIASSTDSTLVRIRLIELFVDHQMGTARSQIESFHHNPREEALVRETAAWAIGQL